MRYDLSTATAGPTTATTPVITRPPSPRPQGSSVCDRACRGYELTRSLDFNSPDSYSAGAVDPEWNGGDGWLPINDNGSGLNAEFEGNGHTISNLYIHRQDTDSVGLFARVGGSGIIRNAGVVNGRDGGARLYRHSGRIKQRHNHRQLRHRQRKRQQLCRRAGWEQQQRRRHHRQLRHRQRKRQQLCRRAGWGQQQGRRHHCQLRHRQRKRHRRCRRTGGGKQRRHHRQLRHRQRKRQGHLCRRGWLGTTAAAAPSPPATPPAA